MSFVSEADIESALLEQLEGLGYTRLSETVSGPDGKTPERGAHSDVILMKRFRRAVDRLNPEIPPGAREDALKQIIATEKPSLIEENRRLHKAIVEGIDVEFYTEDGTIRGDKVYLIDFNNPAANDWLVIPQFTVIENSNNRRPDVVVFVNGLPLGVIELKNPGSESRGTSINSACQQLQTYKKQIPSLFRTNAVLIISDGMMARIGSLTAKRERFMPWRTVDGFEIAPKDHPEMEILIEGLFEKSRFLELLRDFTVFGDTDGGALKIIAGYHQFHAVRAAVRATVRALPNEAGPPPVTPSGPDPDMGERPALYNLPDAASHPPGDRRVGVIWHTQGSGKSLLMAFYVGQLVRCPELQNPTIVIITDRNDLDNQLFSTFSMCKDLIRQTPKQAESRADLQKTLGQNASGGVIFSTIQKFSPARGENEYPVLTRRRNVVVIADEAHRSQYGFTARVERETGDIAYGFAKYLRDALPTASFIGFTGTPIEKDDVNTPAVFGNYIDIYDISRAIEDGATVPIYYESRLARIELPESEKPRIDAEIEELTEDETVSEQERLKRKWSTVEALVGARKRLKMVAADLVRHFEDRVQAMDGKAMIVCMSRRICVALYQEIIALRPDWHSEDDERGFIKLVMTGQASDPEDWQMHIGGDARRNLLAKRAKDPDDPLQMVIVCDMWLTGFDAPSMHTMYIDKPMRGHGLMQAIARVNRVFRGKPGGLIVDYIGIAQNLKNALGQYSDADRKNAGIDEAQAVSLMCEKYEVVCSMFHGFDYKCGLHGSSAERLKVLAGAIDWILERQKEASLKERDPEAMKRAHRRYQDAVLALSKAFALAAASDEAREICDEVGFFQTVRISLLKTAQVNGTSEADQQMAIRQIIDQAIVSTEIVDILSAAGLDTPDISILSEGFLAEIQQMDKKHLALEALRKLLNDEIKSRSRSNVMESRKFSERLQQAIIRYHTSSISTTEVLVELIELAHEMREARGRGEIEGLSQEEIAFYDALSENQSAVEIMGNDSLKVIAVELLQELKKNISVDWLHRESARARMRVLVKKILRKYGYPPDLSNAAVQNVLKQAEQLSFEWME